MEFAIKNFFSFTFIFTPEWKGNYYTWISVPRELISFQLEISQSVCARIKLRGANYNLATYFHNRGSLLNARRAWTLRVEYSVYLSQQQRSAKTFTVKQNNISGNKASYESFSSWYRQFSQTLSMLLDRVSLHQQEAMFKGDMWSRYDCKAQRDFTYLPNIFHSERE